MRDILIATPANYPFELFSKYYSQHVSVNWKFESSDAMADMGGDVLLHSIFEKHLGSLHNWTVSAEFEARFPSMAQAINPRKSRK